MKNNKEYSERDKAVIESWESYRKLGRNKYIFRYGIVSWGLVTWLIYYAINLIVNMINPDWAIPLDNPFTIGMSIVFFAIGGLIFGIVLWNKNEKVYKKKYPYKK